MPPEPPFVSLYDTVGLHLILEYPSGVVYSNQVAGVACLHPELEGILIPLRNDTDEDIHREEGPPFRSPENELFRFFAGPVHNGTGARCGLMKSDADFIDKVLVESQLGEVMTVDRDRLLESFEAWVHVTVHGEEATPPSCRVFRGLGPYPRRGVLTWANTD